MTLQELFFAWWISKFYLNIDIQPSFYGLCFACNYSAFFRDTFIVDVLI